MSGRQPISEEELRACKNCQIETHSESFDQYEDAQTGRNVENTSRDRDMEYIFGHIDSEEDNDTNYEGSVVAPEQKKVVKKRKVTEIHVRKNESKAKQDIRILVKKVNGYMNDKIRRDSYEKEVFSVVSNCPNVYGILKFLECEADQGLEHIDTNRYNKELNEAGGLSHEEILTEINTLNAKIAEINLQLEKFKGLLNIYKYEINKRQTCIKAIIEIHQILAK